MARSCVSSPSAARTGSEVRAYPKFSGEEQGESSAMRLQMRACAEGAETVECLLCARGKAP